MSCCASSCCTTDNQAMVQVQQVPATACCQPSCCTSAGDGIARTIGDRASNLPIAIIGAGPVGLAAAAHLLARNLDCIILEAGPSVGTGPRAWGHVRMFSPWRYNIDVACRDLLAPQGWRQPAVDHFPTGWDLVADYLEPLAQTPQIASQLRLDARVTAIARAGLGKVRSAGRDAASFEIHIGDARGDETRILARGVIDASGTWGNPNPAGASGLPAAGERKARNLIRYGMPDVLGSERSRYAGRRTLVVGTGHSAIGTIIDLCQLATDAPPGTEVIWASRTGDLMRVFGGGAADQLPERGALGTHLKDLVTTGRVTVLAPFAVDTIENPPDDTLLVQGLADQAGSSVTVDQLVVATGLRPDLSILRELRLNLDPALECPSALGPLIDPNVHSCGTVRPHGAFELAQPEFGLFIAGMKSYGRAPTFLLATGYEPVRSIAALLAGDVQAARRVELDLPQTGVCTSDRASDEAVGCCSAEADGSSSRAAKSAGCCGAISADEIEPAEAVQ